MCKFYISALVGVIIEYLDSMHGVTMRIAHVNFIENSFPFFFCGNVCSVYSPVLWLAEVACACNTER